MALAAHRTGDAAAQVTPGLISVQGGDLDAAAKRHADGWSPNKP